LPVSVLQLLKFQDERVGCFALRLTRRASGSSKSTRCVREENHDLSIAYKSVPNSSSPEVERKTANRECQREARQVRKCRGSLQKSRGTWRFSPRQMGREQVSRREVGGGRGTGIQHSPSRPTHSTVSLGAGAHWRRERSSTGVRVSEACWSNCEFGLATQAPPPIPTVKLQCSRR
jgi:hypothetical protein